MDRVLLIMGNMGLGGAETHMMKVYRGIDKDRYQFDFVLNVSGKCYYEDEICALGGRIFRVTPKSNSIIRNYFDIKNIVDKNRYNIVMKCGEQAMSWTEMLAAKRGGARKRIMRSTNSKNVATRVNYIIHAISRYPLCALITDKVAPSKIAGEWLFGKKGCRDLILVHNGVDFEQYRFTKNRREKKRKELEIPENAIVLGHVGRFSEQKNHMFLLDIFYSFYKKNENSYLLLIGDGELRTQIESRIKDLGLKENVICTGNRSDVNELYSVMDAFVFPSLFEGMPNTVIEAQANGMKCYIADTITREANITGLVDYIGIQNPEVWVREIERGRYERTDTEEEFMRHKYDIGSVIKEYELIFSKGK